MTTKKAIQVIAFALYCLRQELKRNQIYSDNTYDGLKEVFEKELED